MRVCNNDDDLSAYMDEALAATDRTDNALDNPILIDKFLADANEALSQGDFKLAEANYRTAFAQAKDPAKRIELALILADFYVDTHDWAKVPQTVKRVITSDAKHIRARNT